MKSQRVLGMLSLACLLLVGSLVAAEAEKADLSKVKCVVSGKPVNPEATADYKGAKVYFCCPGCPKAFAKDTSKFAAKANLQLVATHQAKQKACPLSGKPTKDGKTVEVAGVKVGVCCGNCQKAIASKKGDAQIELAFNDKAFDKGFEVVKKN